MIMIIANMHINGGIQNVTFTIIQNDIYAYHKIIKYTKYKIYVITSYMFK